MAKSKIYIKPSKRGTFTAAAKKHGKSVQGFASQVLANKSNYSPAMVKKANFAKNASKWKHADGGYVEGKGAFPVNEFDQYGLGGWISGALSGLGSGVGTGASLGSAIGAAGGPIGMLGGAAIGGLAGLIGGGIKGNIQEQQQEDLLHKQTRLAEIYAARAKNNKPIETGMQTMVSNQYAPTFACGGKVKKMPFGGTVDTRLVELEEGEPFRDPKGKIGVVKTSAPSHKEGGAPLELEVGTQILGKKKDKVTGKTFKELGRTLAAKKKKADELLKKNKYSANAGKAMNQKLDKQFSDLFARQEQMKKGGKVDAYAYGGKVPKYDGGGMAGLAAMNNLYGLNNWRNQDIPMENWMSTPMWNSPTALPGTSVMPQTPSFDPLTATNMQGATNNGFLGTLGNWAGKQDWGNILGTAASLAPVGYNLFQGMKPAEHLNAQDYYNPEYDRSIGLQRSAINDLSNRKFNIEPILAGNRANQAIGDYNTKTAFAGLGTGAQASNMLANRGQRAGLDAAAWAQKNNMDNSYLGELASGKQNFSGMLANLGGQRAQTNLNTKMINMQSDAARRQMQGAGWTGLSQFAQNRQLMNNMASRDQQRLGIMESMYPFFSQWFNNLNFG